MTDFLTEHTYDHTDRCVQRVIQAIYPPKDHMGALLTELAMERTAKKNAMRRIVDLLGENRDLRAQIQRLKTPTPPSEGGEGTAVNKETSGG